MRVAIYVRVSTNMQVEEGYSLDAQLERCKAYAVSQGWEVAVIYVEEGESAKDLNRTEMKRMLSDASEGLFDVLLVYRLDRLTRSVRDLHSLLDMFEKYNIKFRSASEVYDTTSAMGRLFITIVAALASWERENLGERVRFGKEQLVKEGNWPGGPVLFGYEWNGETMSIIPSEYETLRELRKIYMQGVGLRRTALTLNSKGLIRRDGQLWYPKTVLYVLENPFYAGKIRYGTGKFTRRSRRMLPENTDIIYSDSGYPTVFTWDEFVEQTDQVNKVERYGYSKKNEFWFSGILRCGRCGSRLKGSSFTNKKKDGTSVVNLTYKCSNKLSGHGCDMPMIRQVLAEQLIMKYIDEIVIAQEEVAAAGMELEQVETNYQTEIELLNRELRSLSDRRKKWQYMFAEELMNEVDFRSRKREDDEQERVIKDKIDQLKALSVGTNPQTMNFVVDMSKVWNQLEDAAKKEWAQTIFHSIVIQCEQQSGARENRRGSLDYSITEVNFN